MTTIPSNGNTILPPPRLSGDYKTDGPAIDRWLSDLYAQFILVDVQQMRDRITALETRLTEHGL